MEHDGAPGDDLYAEVQHNLEKGDLTQAHELLRPSLRQEPPPARALELLGHIHEERERPELARHVYHRLSEVHGDKAPLEAFERRAGEAAANLSSLRKTNGIAVLVALAIFLGMEVAASKAQQPIGILHFLQAPLGVLQRLYANSEHVFLTMLLGATGVIAYILWRIIASWPQWQRLHNWKVRLRSGFPNPAIASAACPTCGMETTEWLCVHCGSRVPEEKWDTAVARANQHAGIPANQITRATMSPTEEGGIGTSQGLFAAAWHGARDAVVNPEEGPSRSLRLRAPAETLVAGIILCAATVFIIHVTMRLQMAGITRGMTLSEHLLTMGQMALPILMLAIGLLLTGLATRCRAAAASGFYLAGSACAPLVVPAMYALATRGNSVIPLVTLFGAAVLLMFLVVYHGARRVYGLTPLLAWVLCIALVFFVYHGSSIVQSALDAWTSPPSRASGPQFPQFQPGTVPGFPR